MDVRNVVLRRKMYQDIRGQLDPVPKSGRCLLHTDAEIKHDKIGEVVLAERAKDDLPAIQHLALLVQRRTHALILDVHDVEEALQEVIHKLPCLR